MAKTSNRRSVIVFLVPTYNEADNIVLLHKNLKQASEVEEAHYLFVDDCSTDNTVDVIRSQFHADEVTIIEKEENAGPGDSFNLGMKHVLETYPDKRPTLVTLEADNTSDLGILPEMLMLLDYGYELILASVYAQGGGFSKTSLWRKVISFTANMLLRTVYEIKVQTLSSFYRVYSFALLERLNKHYDEIIQEKGFISMLEILLKSISLKARIVEIPMVLRSDAREGKSKMKVFKTARRYILFLLTFKRKMIKID